MSIRALWYLTTANGAPPWGPDGLYPADLDHYAGLARAIDESDFDGALVATWPNDPFVSASFAAAVTRRMRFLVAIYSGVVPARALAEKAVTFDVFSGGRLEFNAINGTDDRLAPYGIALDHDSRYRASAEYWAELQSAYREGVTTNFHNSPVRLDPVQARIPLWGTGDSHAGLEHAGRVLDHYLTMLRPVAELRPRFERARSAAEASGRDFETYGVLGGVSVRETSREARDLFVEVFTAAGVEAVRETLEEAVRRRTAGAESLRSYTAPDAQRQGWVDAILAGRFPTLDELQVDEGLYAGITAWSPLDIFGTRSSAVYFVGSPDEIAGAVGRLKREFGVGSLILGSWPLETEVARVSELLLPRLADL